LCRRNPHFRQRVQEIGGLVLDRVSIERKPQGPVLPDHVPHLFHASGRKEPLVVPAVAVKLAQLFDKRTGVPRFASRKALLRRFMIADAASIVVTGVDDDPMIERWWAIGQKARRQVIATLCEMGVAIATTPNFSVSVNWPRPGDLAAMKRILLCCAEIMEAGLPAALHVNGRTPRDFERWAEVLRRLDGITHLAYEFTTGAAHGERRDQHVAWLSELAARIDRPLHLIVHGESRVVIPLQRAFAQVTWIDTSSFIKTVHRRRAERSGNDELAWPLVRMPQGAPLHELLAHNVRESRDHFRLRTAA
jgi:hypothetical protein